MLAASKKSKGKTIIGYNYTKNPAVLHARELIETGVIGDVAGFFCRYDVDNEADKKRIRQILISISLELILLSSRWYSFQRQDQQLPWLQSDVQLCYNLFLVSFVLMK